MKIATMRANTIFAVLSLALSLAGYSLTAFAQDTGDPDKAAIEKSFPAKRPYSPYAGRPFPMRVYWGDTHLHTSYSMDAGAFGARLGPKDAYVFAKGNEITASSGQRVKLSRPLDFLVVADHSDGMGFFPMLLSGSQDGTLKLWGAASGAQLRTFEGHSGVVSSWRSPQTGERCCRATAGTGR